MATTADLAPDETAAAAAVGVRRSATYFPEVESLRGIAILLVFLHHADGSISGLDAGKIIVSPLRAFALEGRTGVDLFFVLSGFLLSLPFLAEAAGGKRVVRRDYYARRALRILPLYYAAVVTASVLSATDPSEVLRGVPYLFFLNGVDMATALWPYSAVWWSLATEVEFYLILPLLPFLLRSRLGRWIGAVILCAYALGLWTFLSGSWYASTITGQITLAHSLFGRAPLFLFGGAAAWLYLHHGERLREALSKPTWMRLGGADIALLGIWATLGLTLQWLAWQGYWQVEGHVGHLWHVPEGAFWTAILLLLLLAPVRTKAVFSNRLLSTVGILSYSIYMVHVPLLIVFSRWLRQQGPTLPVGWSAPVVGMVALVLLVCVALSAVTYRFIERPFLTRKARIDR